MGDNLRPSEINNIRKKLRSIARLVKLVRAATSSCYNLSSYLVPKYFDDFVTATRQLGDKSAQLALTIGHYVKQLCQLNISQAIKINDFDAETSCERFLKLYTGQWSTAVSSAISKKQRLGKLNKAIELPKSSDIVALTQWIKREIESQLLKLTDYVYLIKLVMAGLILFNSRRPMEVEEIKISDFKLSLQSRSEREELIDFLSPEEKILAER